MDIVQIDLHLIDEDTDQPRYQFDQEALEELMKSIEELGLLSPIKVRTTPNGRYKIIYGNRRYKASKLLNKPTIPCIVSTSTDELDIYLEQIAENLTREGFSPIEEAEAFHKLMNESKFNSSLKFLASKLGKPENYIKNKCELLKFGNAVRRLIVSGTQIRKDKLTEDQLLPIKDLPIEHRDPLALIVARDELPVSDVKKIAKLFKDKDISPGTKDKLLYKTGYELLQTWSTLQQNKAERERAVEQKAEQAERAAAAKAGQSAEGGAAGAGAVSGAPTAGVVGGAPASIAAVGNDAFQADTGQGNLNGNLTGNATLAEAAALDGVYAVAGEGAPLVAHVQSLLASLSAVGLLPPEALGTYIAADTKGADHANFVAGVNAVILGLEQQLVQWREVKTILDTGV